LNKLIILFLCLNYTIAQTVSSLKKDDILDSLTKLQDTDEENYEEVIFQLTEQVNNYTELRRKECLGEFSTLEINSEGETVGKENKLSKEEKKLCQIELINFKKKYIKNIYKIRRRNLLKNHTQQLENLEKFEAQTLKELDEMSQKIR
jgi:chloramphenicol O-acetyltransferase